MSLVPVSRRPRSCPRRRSTRCSPAGAAGPAAARATSAGEHRRRLLRHPPVHAAVPRVGARPHVLAGARAHRRRQRLLRRQPRVPDRAGRGESASCTSSPIGRTSASRPRATRASPWRAGTSSSSSTATRWSLPAGSSRLRVHLASEAVGLVGAGHQPDRQRGRRCRRGTRPGADSSTKRSSGPPPIPAPPSRSPRVTMFCLAMRRDVHAKLGALDERLRDRHPRGRRLLPARPQGRLHAALRGGRRSSITSARGRSASCSPTASTAGSIARNRDVLRGEVGRRLDPYQRRQSPEYEALVEEVREILTARLPEDSIALVISSGDDRLVDLGELDAWHFPRAAGGEWAGWHPAHRARTRSRGWRSCGSSAPPPRGSPARVLVARLLRRLRPPPRGASCLAMEDEACKVFDLSPRRSRGGRRRAARRSPSDEHGGRGPRGRRPPLPRPDRRLRAIVDILIPEGARVLVDQPGRRSAPAARSAARRSTSRSPPTGLYAGHHPADGAEAVAHLEEPAADAGVDYLVLPATSLWWLDHYPELREALDEDAELVCR